MVPAVYVGASHGYTDTVKTLLLCERVDINLMSRYGQTALMKAVQAGKVSTFLLLMEAGADLSVRNKQGKGILDIAMEKNHENIVKELKRLGISIPE